ncbi:hypothetical protein K469DRAFT_635892 [Zopfia rhizophila CBS 207.26]|uniref:Uncharacterized protein n=1 Tax=Zopfia rhizophila CBS 207.26 TaxID=1314779 RepID=A0A6A6DXP8_9PEZI|nr:hypothetical protein K469DRAFT_635892 [Zopfia rhizophila CBS 207.26]
MVQKVEQNFHLVGSESDFGYSPSDRLLEEHLRPTRYRRCPPWERIVPWILHLLLLCTSFAFFISGFNTRKNLQCPDTWLPLIGNHAPIHTVRFNGTFDRSSPFKGPPSKTVDEAWDAILPLGAMSIPENVFQKLNASKYSAEVPPKAGGGRLALFEGIHLIHCVKTLWMATYPNYYTEEHKYSQEHHEEWRAHIDHCADMLRQKLMCDADPTLITYNWIKNHYAPHPNFNTQHKCRSYDRLLEVQLQHKVDGSRFRNGWILRPKDRPVVEFDEPPFDPNADR